jgi:aminoglycoside 3-N-acetyltransferase
MQNFSDLKGQAERVMSKAERVIFRWSTLIPSKEMRSVLARLTGGGSEILFVHTSLSNCGRFTAGPDDVLRGLGELCDTVAFPTHTYCYPSSPGEGGPLFNPEKTPSKTGLLTEVFRMRPGTLRSIHATHSLAASGPLAAEICSDHYQRDTPCGAGTPYIRLVQRRASVLLFGVTFDSYTLFHTAEDASGSEFAYEYGTLDRLRVVDEHGSQHDCWSRRQARAPRRFKEVGDLLESAGLVRRLTLGRADLLYVSDCSRVHELLVEHLRKTPDFLYRSCTRSLE